MTDLDLPDVNVLVALHHPSHVHHQEAHRWFASSERFATTPITESGLMRLVLNRAVMGEAVDAATALTLLRSLRAHPRATFLHDDSSLAEATIELRGLAGFRQVTDLHLVNLAARHAARLVTFDAAVAPTLAPSDQLLVRTLG